MLVRLPASAFVVVVVASAAAAAARLSRPPLEAKKEKRVRKRVCEYECDNDSFARVAHFQCVSMCICVCRASLVSWKIIAPTTRPRRRQQVRPPEGHKCTRGAPAARSLAYGRQWHCARSLARLTRELHTNTVAEAKAECLEAPPAPSHLLAAPPAQLVLLSHTGAPMNSRPSPPPLQPPQRAKVKSMARGRAEVGGRTLELSHEATIASPSATVQD